VGGQAAVGPPPAHEPWYRTPRYVALLVAGVLIVGGAAVFALTQGGDETPGGTDRAAQDGGSNPNDTPARSRPAPVDPASVTVAVLNGTTVPGLARQVGDRVAAKGFQVGNVDDAPDSDQQRAESVVQFAQGHRREAMAVGGKLGISQREPIDVDVQQLAGDATVVVITGQDQSGQ
jgi:LytR cell envelope-related transcriptional attenuator